MCVCKEKADCSSSLILQIEQHIAELCIKNIGAAMFFGSTAFAGHRSAIFHEARLLQTIAAICNELGGVVGALFEYAYYEPVPFHLHLRYSEQ